MMPGEKAKDFKWSIGKLLAYLGNYKIGIIVVMIFAACATVFNVVGPKVLGKATTALSEGLMNKINGTGGMDFNYRKSPFICAGIIQHQRRFQLYTGLDYDGDYTEAVLPVKERNFRKN